MKIKLKLFATLTKYLDDLPAGTQKEIDLKPGSSVDDLAIFLKIPSTEVKICFVNGIICELDRRLKEGDEVGFFPPIGGG